MDTFQIQAQISSVRTMADKSIRIQLDTQELPAEDVAKIFKLKDIEGIIWAAFKKVPITEKDLEIPEVIDKDIDQKSPSQRLRAVLYRYWEQNKKGMDFKLFYRRQMTKWIDTIKEKLV